MSTTAPAPFRLAFRAEGEFVNVYYAAIDTMEGAMFLSSMRRSMLDATPGAFVKWQELMREILSVACVDAMGAAPVSFDSRVAPEHERSGRG